jgi:hypothetical protein
MSSPRTIIALQATTMTDERLLGEAANPGHLVTLESDNKYYKQATAKGNAQMMVLREDDLQGKGVSDAYASGALARAAQLRSGDRFYARLAAAAVVKIGGLLEAAGGGQFQAYTNGVALVKALEAVSVAATADDFVLVEVL